MTRQFDVAVERDSEGWFVASVPVLPGRHTRARKRSPSERLELVDDILASLDGPDSNIDRPWAREAEDRLPAYRRGEIKAIPLERVLAKYRWT